MKRHYIVLLFLHAALAVLAGQLRLPLDNILSCSTDYSTEYAYDRNANITSLTRMGIIDKVALRNIYGLHSRYTMQYSRNQLWRMNIEKEGADYEGRTGVGATGNISDFRYDANGNLGRDLSRDIVHTRFSRLNKPVDVYFLHGHRQTVTYDGFGNKRRVTYSQTSDPILATMMGVPEDSAYTLQGRRNYIGPHVFAGDSLEYSAFSGGYFTPTGVYYYITDWQGNNIAVFSKDGTKVQSTTYYPYGEPTIEPTGQRWLFGGKEREHAGGNNSFDFGARNLTPEGGWSSPDKKSDTYPGTSPFSYCGGDPINFIDPTGNDLVILGKDNCSITLTSTLIDFSVNASWLGLNLGGNYVLPGDELLSAALDIIGFVDQTGVADGLNAIIQAKNGHYFDAALSTFAAVPLLGNFAIVGKIEPAFDAFRTALNVSIGGSTAYTKLVTAFHKHHLIPKAIYKNAITGLSDVLVRDSTKNLIELPKGFHGNHPAYNSWIASEIEKMIQSAEGITQKGINELLEKAKKLIGEALENYKKTDGAQNLNDFFKSYNK